VILGGLPLAVWHVTALAVTVAEYYPFVWCDIATPGIPLFLRKLLTVTFVLAPSLPACSANLICKLRGTRARLPTDFPSHEYHRKAVPPSSVPTSFLLVGDVVGGFQPCSIAKGPFGCESI
jgi:hypothetical protein